MYMVQYCCYWVPESVDQMELCMGEVIPVIVVFTSRDVLQLNKFCFEGSVFVVSLTHNVILSKAPLKPTSALTHLACPCLLVD